jgi:lipopolysaccharide biosynthesis regulator YciM
VLSFLGITCKQPHDITGAVKTVTGTYISHKVTYKCKYECGYKKRSYVRTCQKDGTWSGNDKFECVVEQSETPAGKVSK